MTWMESNCPYCGIDTSGTLPMSDIENGRMVATYPCKKCVKEHYEVRDGLLVKKRKEK